MNLSLPMAWPAIEAALDTLQPVSGGFTTAERGIVTLKDGQAIFVKCGTDEDTDRWTTKEIAVYEFLARQQVTFAPRLLAANANHTAFAIDALESKDDWDWTATWTEERLAHTLAGMDAIAAISLVGNDKQFFTASPGEEHADGWQQLIGQPDLQSLLRDKLRAARRSDVADLVSFADDAIRSSHFIARHDALVHNDVRADNCAWNPATQTVKFVDWTWAQLGDRRIDMGSFLVHVHKTGFDVLDNHAGRLDADALHWLAGFWFASALRPLLEGGPERAALRDHQLASGIVAFDLAQALSARA
ncbi:MAG: phosphotransferase [Candidatus Saccharibacteria bacterium]